MSLKTTELDGDTENGAIAESKLTLFDAIRAFGVVFGPPLLLDLFMAGSVAAMVKRMFARQARTRVARRPHPLALLGTGLAVLYPLVVRPWMQRWGRPTRKHTCHSPAMIWCPSPRSHRRAP